MEKKSKRKISSKYDNTEGRNPQKIGPKLFKRIFKYEEVMRLSNMIFKEYYAVSNNYYYVRYKDNFPRLLKDRFLKVSSDFFLDNKVRMAELNYSQKILDELSQLYSSRKCCCTRDKFLGTLSEMIVIEFVIMLEI
jgi:hypothetical protein